MFPERLHKARGLLLASLCVLLALVPTFLFVSTVRADDVSDFSFYERVSSIVGEVNETLAPSTEEDHDSDLKGGRTGNVGVYLGYSDENKNESGIVGWFITQLSNSSSTVSYKNLEDVPTQGGDTTNALLCYAGYGWLLQELGVDATSNDGNVITQMVRVVFGGLLGIGYAISCVVPLIFKVALEAMRVLNPFKLFGDVVEIGATSYDGLFADLCTYISTMYKAIQNFSLMFLVPFMAAFTIAGCLLFNNPPGERGKKVIRYALRVLFIVAGVPIIGSTYTAILDAMANPNGAFGIVNSSGQTIVYSVLVDFESWARDTRLDPPGNTLAVKWHDDHFEVGDDCKTGNQLALAINRVTHGIAVEDNDEESLSHIDASEDTSGLYTNMTGVWNMIGRYMSGAKYSSSSFESEQKTSLTNGGFDDEELVKWFDPKKTSLKEDTIDLSGDGTIFNNGALHGGGGSIGGVGQAFTFAGSGNGNGTDVSSKVGLSTLSMYNYLNTSFNNTELTVYSPKKSSSGYVRDSHMSVNSVGTGPGGLLMLAQAVVELFVIGIIGISYGFALLFSNIKRGYRIIFDVPLASMGSFQAIGKILTYVCVLLAEIIGTMLMYDVVVNLLVSIVDLLSLFLLGSGSILAGAIILTGPIGIIITCLFTISVLVYLCRQALKLRKAFIRGVDEMAGNVISKFVVHAEKSGAMVQPTFDADRQTESAIHGIAQPAAGPDVGSAVRSGINKLGKAMAIRDGLSAIAGGGQMAADGSSPDGEAAGTAGATDRDNMARANDILDGGGIVGAKGADGSGMRDAMGREGMAQAANAAGAAGVRDAMGTGMAAGAGSMAGAGVGSAAAAGAATPAGAAALAASAASQAAAGVAQKLASDGGSPMDDRSLSGGGLREDGGQGPAGASQAGVAAAMSDEPDGTRDGAGAGDVVTDRSGEARAGLAGDHTDPPGYGDSAGGMIGPDIQESPAGGSGIAAGGNNALPAAFGTAGAKDGKDGASQAAGAAGMQPGAVPGQPPVPGAAAAQAGQSAGQAKANGPEGTKGIQADGKAAKGADGSNGANAAGAKAAAGDGVKGVSRQATEGAAKTAVKGVAGAAASVPGGADALKKVEGAKSSIKGAATGMSGAMGRGAASAVKGVQAGGPAGEAAKAAAKAAQAATQGSKARADAVQGGEGAHYNAKNVERSSPFGQNGTKAGAARGANVKGPSAGAGNTAGASMGRGNGARGYRAANPPATASGSRPGGTRAGMASSGIRPDVQKDIVGNYRNAQAKANAETMSNRKRGTLEAAKGAAMMAAGVYAGNSYMTMKGVQNLSKGTMARTAYGGTSVREQKIVGSMSKAVGQMIGSDRLQAQGQALYQGGMKQQQRIQQQAQQQPYFNNMGQQQRQRDARQAAYKDTPGGNVFGGRNASGGGRNGGYGG